MAAQADSCYPFFPSTCFSGHAVWLPGLDAFIQAPACDPANGAASGTDGFKYVFSPAGSFVENLNDTANLTGHVESTLHPGYGFNVNVTFTGFTTSPCGMPMDELEPSCYKPSGPVDPSTWHFYTGASGTLTGTGNYAGAVVNIFPAGGMGCFQVGDGASGKNVQYGASGWFDYTIMSQPTNPAFQLQQGGRTADFNFNCSPPGPRPLASPTPTPTPTPTAAPKHGKGH